MRFYKRLFAAGIFAYAGLFVVAFIYYKERMVLPDDANYVFDLVTNHGHFAIFHQRFISVLTQWLPFTAVRLGLPLGTVARLYSVNFIIFHFACYLLCGLLYRNYQAALTLLICNLLFTTYTFYWMVSELGLGIALFFPVIAMLSGERAFTGKARLPEAMACVAMIVTVAFAHTLMIFVVSFLLLYLWMAQPQSRRRLGFTALLYVGALLLKSIVRDDYDDHALGGLRNFIRLFPDYFNTESMRRFLTLCTGKYGWIPIVFTMNAACYIRDKRWRRLMLMTVYSVSYLLLITISFPNVDGHDFYQENLYLPLAVFLSVPLVYDVLPQLKQQYVAGILALMLSTGLYRIYAAHGQFSARLDWQRSLIRQYDGRKVILSEQTFPKDTLMMAWSSSYEFWLLSTMEQHKTASILITPQPEKYTGMAGSGIFMPSFGLFRYSELPARYFIFPDTVSRYEWIR